MKALVLFSMVACRLAAQGGGSGVVDFGSNVIDAKFTGANLYGQKLLLSNIKYTWQITRADNGDKTFSFIAYKCLYAIKVSTSDGGVLALPLFVPVCDVLSQSAAEVLGPVEAGMAEFNSLAPGEVAHTVKYGPFVDAGRPRVTLVQPILPPNPQMIMFDGFSYDILKFDLTNFSIVSRITLPQQNRLFAVRPTATGPANEVWTAHAGLVNEISICDLDAQKLLATIPTPSLDPNNFTPAGLVFTNSGNTALYAVNYFNADSAGNLGALLVFDVIARKLTATLPLKFAPSNLLMAPDGLTAYLVGGGKIAYYDVVSGTADLTAQFQFFSGNIFIHPDGTRLFFNNGQLAVFDLTSRKVTNQFPFGFPTIGGGSSLQMSQDGSTVFAGDAVGDVIFIDTRYGNIMASYKSTAASVVFGGTYN